MDKDTKFAQDAIKQAQRETIEREAQAFKEFMDTRGMDTMMKAMAFAGELDMFKLVSTVQRMGMEETMHKYEKALLTLAFHEGATAERMGGTK